MSDNVVDLQAYKGGYATGQAKCMKCGFEWVHVNTVDGDPFFDCPKCELHFGHFIYPIERENDHWHCGCSNQLFRITDKGAYCPRCGVKVEDY